MSINTAGQREVNHVDVFRRQRFQLKKRWKMNIMDYDSASLDELSAHGYIFMGACSQSNHCFTLLKK